METPFDFDHAMKVYQKILSDIQQGINLEQHLKDVEESIEDIDQKISQSEIPHPGFEKLKNELYYLKYEILERT